jgi:Arc/MetJ family transcription regulator
MPGRAAAVCSSGMTRRTSILVDDDLLERARRALGTSGLTDTIEKALSEAVRADQRRRLIARFRDPDGYDDEALLEARASWTRS